MNLKTVVSSFLLSVFLISSCFANGNQLDYPHSTTNNVNCADCHYTPSLTLLDPAWVNDPPEHIDDLPFNNFCWNCHDGSQAQAVETHSSRTTSDKYGGWNIECRTCHWPHHIMQYREYGSESFEESGTSANVTFSTLSVAGTPWAANQFQGYILMPDISKETFNYKILSNTENEITVTGVIDTGEITSGKTFAIIYGNLVKATISTPNSGDKQVKFFRNQGANSFADGDSTYNGPCEVCHTQTNHFRNNGTAPEQNHENLDGGKQGSNCVGACHSHANGFAHGQGGQGSIGCVQCHGHEAGAAYDPDMQYPYEPQAATSQGRGTTKSHSTHTEIDADDQKGPAIYCDSCHDINNMPYFKLGTDADQNGRISLSETDVCDACHSPGGDYDGINDAAVGAKVNWRTGVYEADATTLQPGKDKWCATCHDKAPSVIQSVDAPNVVGDETGDYLYGTGWGFYKTGHGLPGNQNYPSKDGPFPPLMLSEPGIENGNARAITCDKCHDFSAKHIDGVDRTYGTQAATLLPSHYRQGYRLKMIGGAEPMEIPKTPGGENIFDDYLLCFQCHESQPFLERDDEQSNMAQRSTGDANLKVGHQYHLGLPSGNAKWQSDWRGSFNSGVTCPQCHNVHGSKNLAMLSDGSLTGTEPGLQFYYYNRALTTSYGPPSPSNLPLRLEDGFQWLPLSTTRVGCSGVCHSQTSYRTFEWTPYNVPNWNPILDWTGETNYEADSVYPKTGNSGDNFTFRVLYQDYLLDMNDQGFYNKPSYIRVLLDLDNNGEFESAYSMTAVGGVQPNGRLYEKTIAIRNTYSNTIPYKIAAGDGPDTVTTGSSPSGLPAVGDPTVEGLIQLINRSPALAWTNETHYEADGVNPNIGAAGGSFTFRVLYSDPDSQSPDANGVRVLVDGAEYPMTELAGGYYDTAKTYTATITLNTVGDLNYRFLANDYFGAPASGDPTLDSVVSVQAASTPPTLSWVSEPGRVEGVKPASGLSGDEFEFRIEYADIADQRPPAAGYIKVWIDKNDDDIVDPGETLSMREEVPGAGCLDGKLYKASTRLLYAGDGVLKYRFMASNGADEAVGEPTNDRYLTVVDSPVLTTSEDFASANLAGTTVGGEGAEGYIVLEPGPEDWRLLNTTGEAPSSTSGPMVYDSLNRKFVYFYGNTWEFDPALNLWTKTAPPVSPPATYNNNGWGGSSIMTYDPVRGKAVMLDYNGKTWEYGSGVWTDKGAVNINPLGKKHFKYAMVYDESIDKVLLIGGVSGAGVDGTAYNETWAYDSVRNSWEPVLFNNTNPPEGKGFWFSKMHQTLAFFDSENNKTVAVLGHGYSYGSSTTKTYNFGASDWIYADLGVQPPNRMYKTPLAYDSDNKRGILYGGTFNDQPQYETWAFDSASSTWQQLTTSNSPTSSSGSIDYDDYMHRMILNGGSQGTWAFGPTYSTESEGTVSGLLIDAGEGLIGTWNTLVWDAFTPTGTSVSFQIRSGNSQAELDAAVFAGPDGTDQTFFTESPSWLGGPVNARFVELQAILSTTDTATSPRLNSAMVRDLTSIDVEPQTTRIFTAETVQFTATATFADGLAADMTSVADWTSSDELTATINADGLAYGVEVGIADISAAFGGVIGAPGLLTVSAGQRAPDGTGALISVPTDCPTIAAAIEAAQNGDEIMVADGDYPEAVDFLGKAVKIVSENGPENCSIDSALFTNGEGNGSELSGFSFTGSETVLEVIDSSPTVSGCVFESVSAATGGVMEISGGSPIISGCVFKNNSADGNGIIQLYGTTAILENTLIADNDDTGVRLHDSSPLIVNCTIRGNISIDPGNGGGIRISGISTATVFNSIVWENNPTQIQIDEGGADVSYSAAAGQAGVGNIADNPLFISADDSRLSADSPCIDAGSPKGILGSDLDGEPRIQGGSVDMGAFESAY